MSAAEQLLRAGDDNAVPRTHGRTSSRRAERGIQHGAKLRDIGSGIHEKLKKYQGINKESYFITSNSTEKQKYVLASCCTPILGESVIGFKASDGTITVHRRTCANANSLAAKFGDKIISVQWAEEENSKNSYLARIYLKGTDRIGIINDITILTSKVMGVNIRRFNIGTEDGIFDGFIDLYVHNIDSLDTLITKIRKINGIESVVKKEL